MSASKQQIFFVCKLHAFNMYIYTFYGVVCSKSTFNSSAIVLDDQQLAFPKQCTTKLEHSEPVGPCMSTCVPGPESKHLTHELANIQVSILLSNLSYFLSLFDFVHNGHV